MNQILNVKPSGKDIFRDIMAFIKDFVRNLEKMNFKLIRTNSFNFIMRNVFKSEFEEPEEKNILRDFIYCIADYIPATKKLEDLLTFIEE